MRREGSSIVDVELQALGEKQAQWDALEVRVQENIAAAAGAITLDVGGTLFKTSKSTLLRFDGSYFHALLGSGRWQPDDLAHKTFFLDLDPTAFHHVLRFLRTGELFLDDLSASDRFHVQHCLDYLYLPSLSTKAPPVPPPEPWLWDLASCTTSDVRFSGRCRVVHMGHNSHYVSVVGNTPVTSCRLELNKISEDTCIGFLPRLSDGDWPPARVMRLRSFFFRPATGRLRADGNGATDKAYTSKTFRVGHVLGMRYINGRISFQRDDEDLGVAFDVDDLPVNIPMYPVVASTSFAAVTILE
ncbi:Aste57867_23948 [Aphanomyces stellatus]|uniref:Aste57867_23948 protein n=1 Tax=Aphanomyces stellatus TaxID=120398 RepID=A0A485LP49_9STRA|nr:hypothetical protein As57867_023875 [Aphanomyces stellatus]VFU00591.1 Aste57867_23948 [Aphanomyces stellatus]